MGVYKDYYWDRGYPMGKEKQKEKEGRGYRILSDPYHKRLSIERYEGGKYHSTLYDSHLFDFRHLNPQSQVAWHREVLEESEEHLLCAVRNIDDRVIYLEESDYKQGRCLESRIYSPHRVLVGTQKVFYQDRGERWNGVLLRDGGGKVVMWKLYEVGEDGEFAHLIKESWKVVSEEESELASLMAPSKGFEGGSQG